MTLMETIKQECENAWDCLVLIEAFGEKIGELPIDNVLVGDSTSNLIFKDYKESIINNIGLIAEHLARVEEALKQEEKKMIEFQNRVLEVCKNEEAD